MFVYGATRGRHHGRKATAGRLAQHAFSAFRAKAYFTGRYIRARSKGEHGAKAVYMGIWASPPIWGYRRGALPSVVSAPFVTGVVLDCDGGHNHQVTTPGSTLDPMRAAG